MAEGRSSLTWVLEMKIGTNSPEDPNQAFIEVPNKLVPTIRELIARKTELPQNV
jgi:hypothetical protein